MQYNKLSLLVMPTLSKSTASLVFLSVNCELDAWEWFMFNRIILYLIFPYYTS